MKKFLSGMLFALLGLSLLDDITAILTNLTQLFCYKIAKQTYQIKKQLAITQEDQQEQNNPIGFQTNCIGFQIESPQQEEEQ